jgi:hypothetical protein
VSLLGGIVSDFIFVDWICNAILYPEAFHLNDALPVTSSARRNLQVIPIHLVYGVFVSSSPSSSSFGFFIVFASIFLDGLLQVHPHPNVRPWPQ